MTFSRSLTSRAAGLALAPILGAMSLLAMGAPAAQAGSGAAPTVQAAPQGPQTLRNQATGECLDDSRRYGLRTFSCHYRQWQRWYVKRWNNGTVRLRNQATGECLDDSRRYGLRTFSCHHGQWQRWYVKRWNNGTIRLRNQATGKCLDDSRRYGLRTFSCHNGKWQRWS